MQILMVAQRDAKDPQNLADVEGLLKGTKIIVILDWCAYLKISYYSWSYLGSTPLSTKECNSHLSRSQPIWTLTEAI
jgi:hypothetical protein